MDAAQRADIVDEAARALAPRRLGDRPAGDVDAVVVLVRGATAPLRELLPAHEWPEPEG